MTVSGGAMPDLSMCDRDPIALYEYIQGFGFLIAMAKDGTIVRASANLNEHLGVGATQVLGTKLDGIVSEAAHEEVRKRISSLYATSNERLFGVDLLGSGQRFDLNMHFIGDTLVIEGEPSNDDDSLEAASMVRAMMARLVKQTSLDDFHSDAARQVRAITGYDRVMIYRFDRDGVGEVIAEATQTGIKSFLGLHFPAAEIPPQARALALRSPYRIIPDISSAQVQILPTASASVPPLDQSLAITRGVSPVHVEYLTNMGIAASMTISIVVDAQLWGLITCHHHLPRLPSFVMRTAAELFGGMYSITLESRLRQTSVIEEQGAREVADRLVAAVAANEALLGDAAWLQRMIGEMIDIDGVAISRHGKTVCNGSTPDADDIAVIVKTLDATGLHRMFDTDCLTSAMPESSVAPDTAAGMLAIPVSRLPGDYVLLFRRERLQEIKWSGDPTKTMVAMDDGFRLSPRKSFAAFVESVRGKSMPFTDLERRNGEAIRVAMIEVVLRLTEAAVEERRQAGERQELLIAELNHRVRNILSLIRGLINQTGGNAIDVATYVASLGGRVQSLARAHDQVTRLSWGPSLLNVLFDDEIAAHAVAARGRLVVEGPPTLLKPIAITTMALVIHELVTNSVKYGALSAKGRVVVTIEHDEGAGLWLRWRESGGPPVTAPVRRGFGSVIVERFVPFDLGGKAEVRYALGGLEADFFIPEAHVSPVPVVAEALAAKSRLNGAALPEKAKLPLEGLSVLLVEDNMIIAMEAEDMLGNLGAATIATASTIDEADTAFAAKLFDFAMLDVSVGMKTSFDLALRLKRAGVPYVFASGYGNQVPLEADHAGAVVVQKPYEQAHLASAIGVVMERVTPAE